MGRLEDIRKKVLAKALADKKTISEGRIRYDEGCGIKMHPTLEQQLRERKHSLGSHPIFPDSEEINFEEKIMTKRFNEVVSAYKRHHDTENVSMNELLNNQQFHSFLLSFRIFFFLFLYCKN